MEMVILIIICWKKEMVCYICMTYIDYTVIYAFYFDTEYEDEDHPSWLAFPAQDNVPVSGYTYTFMDNVHTYTFIDN